MMKRVLLSLACLVAVSSLASAEDATLVAKGQALAVKNKCSMCHQLAGKGGRIGKPLDGLFDRTDAAAVTKILTDPATGLTAEQKAFNKTPMPKVSWQKGDIEAMLAYLQSLKATPPAK